MPGEVALVRESGLGGDIGEPGAGIAQTGAGVFQPPQHQITIRRRAQAPPEMPGQREPVEAGFGLEIAGRDDLPKPRIENFSGATHRDIGGGRAARAPRGWVESE
jgi:hypothetical protein